MKRKSDTSIFVGVDCEVCRERVKLGDKSAVWQSFPEVKGWHWGCWYDGPLCPDCGFIHPDGRHRPSWAVKP